MISVENQHWVPRFLLKQFADRDGRIYCLNKTTDAVTKPSPRKTAARGDFYEYKMKGKDVSFEQTFQKLETQSAPLLKQIANRRSTAGLDARQKGYIASFIAVQSFRTEAFLEGFNAPVEHFGEVLSHLCESAFIPAADIADRPWCTLTIEGDDTFYLGDNPVVLQNFKDPSKVGPLGFDMVGVEIFLPVHPKVALYIPCRQYARELTFWYDFAISSHRAMRIAASSGRNLAGVTPEFLHWSQGMIRTGAGLAQGLRTGGSVAATPENIENLNYLQCSWAFSNIYSPQRDFSFARRVFREQPQYRGSPRTSIERAALLRRG